MTIKDLKKILEQSIDDNALVNIPELDGDFKKKDIRSNYDDENNLDLYVISKGNESE